jgi:non-ribosomal peptide synthetase component F
LSRTEYQQYLEEWNATQRIYPAEQCVQQLIEAQVERTPESVAAICEQEHLSYRELNRRANQLAHYLQAQGVGPEVRVGLALEPSVAMLIALLGVLKAGGCYVPLDLDAPPERAAFVLR